MSDIDINAGLAVKADINKLHTELKGSYAKFKEDRRYNKAAYEDLLEKYGKAVKEIEKVKKSVDMVLEGANKSKLPEASELQVIDAMAGLFGAKKSDGSIDIEKFIDLGNKFKGK